MMHTMYAVHTNAELLRPIENDPGRYTQLEVELAQRLREEMDAQEDVANWRSCEGPM
jgi:hypothetical protein